jgi:hypothetical protein
VLIRIGRAISCLLMAVWLAYMFTEWRPAILASFGPGSMIETLPGTLRLSLLLFGLLNFPGVLLGTLVQLLILRPLGLSAVAEATTWFALMAALSLSWWWLLGWISRKRLAAAPHRPQ